MYGPQYYDYKIVFNIALVCQVPYYRTRKGTVGHVVGGWSFAPLFTAHTGSPLRVYSSAGDCQSFGEGNCSTESSLDGAVLASKYTGGNSPHYNQLVSESATTNPLGVGIATNKNPAQVFNEFRPCVLGLDTSCGSSGNIRGPGFWNMDLTVNKDIGVWNRRTRRRVP